MTARVLVLPTPAGAAGAFDIVYDKLVDEGTDPAAARKEIERRRKDKADAGAWLSALQATFGIRVAAQGLCRPKEGGVG